MSTRLEEQEARSGAVAAPPEPPTGTPPAVAEAVRRGAVTPELAQAYLRATPPVLRPAIGAGLASFGAAFLVGGMFVGVAPRVYAAIGALFGVAMAAWAARATRRATAVQVISLVALGLAGAAALLTLGVGSLSRLTDLVGQAVDAGKLRKPPAPFDDGWRPILVWTMGLFGYGACWIATEMRRPAAGVLVPIPIIAFAAIAQPPEQQIVGGVVALVSFVLALAVIFRADRDEAGRMPVSFEIRRAAKAAPLVVALTVGMVGLAQANLLFPRPLYDPTQKAILPKAVPLTNVKDRVLMVVESISTGPWRTGVLDVYDGQAWRLPPFASSSLKAVPDTGILDAGLRPGARVHFAIRGLEGTVLPMPTRASAMVGNLPALVSDARTGTVRVSSGQVTDGLTYDAAFALLPAAEQLRAAPRPADDMKEFLEAPEPPSQVRALIAAAPPGLWDRLDVVRKRLLDTVISTGSGLPKAVPPSRVEDMLFGNKEATPFEIVAAQALLARWAGVPSRIGYGFDGGDEIAPDRREIHPKHGSLWLEVNFRGFGWLPITGFPKQAKRSLGQGQQTIEAPSTPSDQIGVDIFVPLKVPPADLLFKRFQLIAAIVLPALALALLAWVLWPAVYKARMRARRRAWAFRAGPAARIAVAYAELRDLATDLGLGDRRATPIAFLERVVSDEEHTEMAWLVTRALWGDLAGRVTDDDVLAAEELARSLRRRMFEVQPFTVRAISVVSRLSIRTPFAPELFPARRRRVPIPAILRRRKAVPVGAS